MQIPRLPKGDRKECAVRNNKNKTELQAKPGLQVRGLWTNFKNAHYMFYMKGYEDIIMVHEHVAT